MGTGMVVIGARLSLAITTFYIWTVFVFSRVRDADVLI